jgi:hypothetical protein
MLTAPAEWLVEVVARLPPALRPGVFLALVVLIVWFVFVRRGLPDLWHALWRGGARLVDALVAGPLLLEYAVTSSRRRRGEPPPQWALALGGVTDVVLDGAASVYERHERSRSVRSGDEAATSDGGDDAAADAPQPAPARRPSARPPVARASTVWIACALIVGISTTAWIVMDGLPDTSIAKYRLTQAFDPWRDVEAWAGVDSGRREPPALVRVHRHRAAMGVRVACGADLCRGWILLRSRSHHLVAARYVEMTSGRATVHLPLSRKQARTSRGGSVAVKRV